MSCRRPLSPNNIFFFLGADDQSRRMSRVYRNRTAIATVTHIHPRRPRLSRTPRVALRVDQQLCAPHTSVRAERSATDRTRLRYADESPMSPCAESCVSEMVASKTVPRVPTCARLVQTDASETFRHCRARRAASLTLSPQLTESMKTEEEATLDGERFVAYGPRAKSNAASPYAFGFFHLSVATPHPVCQRSSPVGAASLRARGIFRRPSVRSVAPLGSPRPRALEDAALGSRAPSSHPAHSSPTPSTESEGGARVRYGTTARRARAVADARVGFFFF